MKNTNQKRRNRNKRRVLGCMVGWRSKEHALIRKWIEENGYRPRIEHHLWVPFLVEDLNGDPIFVSDGYSRQIGRMLRQGRWPELLTPKMAERAERALREKRAWQRQERLYS